MNRSKLSEAKADMRCQICLRQSHIVCAICQEYGQLACYCERHKERHREKLHQALWESWTD